MTSTIRHSHSPVTTTIAMVVAAVLAVLGTSTSANAIMRRHDVPDEQYVVAAEDYPQIVDLLAPGDCLGTLIAPSWIITAAHCAAHLPTSGHALSIAGADHEIEGVMCHPSYDGDEHDVALVKLLEPVEDLMPLPVYRGDDEAGQGVLFVGRGDNGTGRGGQRNASNDGLTRAATNTVHRTDGAWLEFIFHEPGDGGITQREGISGDGDSGGPALIETGAGLAVAGVSSWQDARPRKVGKYGVHDFYTRLSRELAFIDAVTGDDWDGEFRRCPPESGCRVGQGAPPGSLGLALGMLVLAGVRRRRRDDATNER